MARARRGGDYALFWPGYVDVLSTLLLVVTFLMSIFMLAQYFASQEASGKDTALKKLTLQITELTNLLALEKGKSKSAEDELAALQASLASLSFCTSVVLSVLPFSIASDHCTFRPAAMAQL